VLFTLEKGGIVDDDSNMIDTSPDRSCYRHPFNAFNSHLYSSNLTINIYVTYNITEL